ncbi:MAG: hypothetical protein GQ565_06290 [Candidatus Aegiribacteria sp.]|nr:hypothetical protein [Candidatus Aegiribacteria sp.]
MVFSNEPTDDLMREMYANFGLAYYHSEVLHRGLAIILATSNLPHRDLITRPRIEEKLAHAFSLTLGDVITELVGKIPSEYSTRLDQIREKRNFLAHHFFFDRAHLMFRADHICQLIDELNGYTELFNRLDKETSQWFHNRQHEFGLTDEILQDSLTRILSGDGEEPLPGKEVVKDREKKLKRKQRLVRVWEFNLPDGGKSLVFEMQDGSLWQLCDVGLGWTQFQSTEPHWVEHPAIKPHLPADIIPRPVAIKPWEYEFKLKAGTALWVKPGKHDRTFLWGLRTKNRNTEKKT